VIIDAHQHVWDLDRSPYRWLGPHVPQWNRTFTFDELAPHLRRNGVDATVLVQSDDDRDTDLTPSTTSPCCRGISSTCRRCPSGTRGCAW
jgi:predicted TIM-barrel fold metal-dependent hydrolase